VKKSHSPNAQANLVALWNRKYPIGTKVHYSDKTGANLTTRTDSTAFIVVYGSTKTKQACVLLEGFTQCYRLTMCSPIVAKPK
jgi:hypothetical protein